MGGEGGRELHLKKELKLKICSKRFSPNFSILGEKKSRKSFERLSSSSNLIDIDLSLEKDPKVLTSKSAPLSRKKSSAGFLRKDGSGSYEADKSMKQFAFV